MWVGGEYGDRDSDDKHPPPQELTHECERWPGLGTRREPYSGWGQAPAHHRDGEAPSIHQPEHQRGGGIGLELEKSMSDFISSQKKEK